MAAHMSATITLVQLAEGEEIYAVVAYGSGDTTKPQHRTRMHLEAPQDVTDCRDWLRQLAASLTEAL